MSAIGSFIAGMFFGMCLIGFLFPEKFQDTGKTNSSWEGGDHE
jgi:hypothetical protein